VPRLLVAADTPMLLAAVDQSSGRPTRPIISPTRTPALPHANHHRGHSLPGKDYYYDIKNVQIKILKNVKNVKKPDKNKKNVCKRNKKRYLFLV